MCWDCLDSAERENVFDWLAHLSATLTDTDAATGDKLSAAGFYQSIKTAMVNDDSLPGWATDPYVDPKRLPANRQSPLRLER